MTVIALLLAGISFLLDSIHRIGEVVKDGSAFQELRDLGGWSWFLVVQATVASATFSFALFEIIREGTLSYWWPTGVALVIVAAVLIFAPWYAKRVKRRRAAAAGTATAVAP